jgi:hypothetical protein
VVPLQYVFSLLNAIVVQKQFMRPYFSLSRLNPALWRIEGSLRWWNGIRRFWPEGAFMKHDFCEELFTQ